MKSIDELLHRIAEFNDEYWCILNSYLIDWLIDWFIDHQTAAHAFIQDLQLDIVF